MTENTQASEKAEPAKQNPQQRNKGEFKAVLDVCHRLTKIDPKFVDQYLRWKRVDKKTAEAVSASTASKPLRGGVEGDKEGSRKGSGSKSPITEKGQRKQRQKELSTTQSKLTEKKDDAATSSARDGGVPKGQDKTSVQTKDESLNAKRDSFSDIVLGPRMEMVLRDSTLAMAATVLVALVPAIAFRGSIRWDHVPMPVALVWMIVTFLLGFQIAPKETKSTLSAEVEKEAPPVADAFATEPAVEPTEMKSNNSRELQDSSTKHSFLAGAMKRLRNSKIKVLRVRVEEYNVRELPSLAISGHKRNVASWEKNVNAPTSSLLMNHLLKNPDYGREEVMLEELETVQEGEEEERGGAADDKDAVCTRMGEIDLAMTPAASLKTAVVEPLLSIRGMDVFLAQYGENKLGSHPFLIENGLRDVPCCLVNLLFPFGNICIYFNLPEWVTNWSDIVESKDDPKDVKALKRFLNNEDDYRNNRLKIVPCVVSGPLAIKILAPNKKAIPFQTEYVGMNWTQHHREVTSDGRVLQMLYEVELDFAKHEFMRKVGSLVKKNLRSICVDLAAIVEKPAEHQEDEPSACLGVWRFDRIDMDACPTLPPRLDDVQQALEYRQQ